MKLTENQLEEIQTKVSEATSDAFRKTILDVVKDYNKSKKDGKKFYSSRWRRRNRSLLAK